MKTLLLHAARALGLFRLSRRLTRKGLRILCYHGIWLGEGHFGDRLYMRAATFRDRVARLAASGYPVLPLGEAVERLKAGTLPDCATVITIDDAWYGTYRHMIPALAEQSMPATLYVTSHYAEEQCPVFDVALRYLFERASKRSLDLAAIPMHLPAELRRTIDLADDQERGQALRMLVAHGDASLDEAGKMALCRAVAGQLGHDYDDLVRRRIFHLMSMEELRDVAEQGFDLQLHTHHHRISDEGENSIDDTLVSNREWLEPIVDKPLTHFCYPSGVWREADWPQLQAAGIKTATTTDAGLNFPDAPPLALSRIVDGEGTSWLEIEAELAGFLEVGRQVRRRLRRA